MPLPDTKEALEAAGYVFDNEARCKGETCGAMIEWWIGPNGQKHPISVVEVKEERRIFSPQYGTPVVSFKRISHFIDCPDRKDFRKKEKRK